MGFRTSRNDNFLLKGWIPDQPTLKLRYGKQAGMTVHRKDSEPVYHAVQGVAGMTISSNSPKQEPHAVGDHRGGATDEECFSECEHEAFFGHMPAKRSEEQEADYGCGA